MTLIEKLTLGGIILLVLALVFAPEVPVLGPNPHYKPEPRKADYECVMGLAVYGGKQLLDAEGKGVPCN